MICPYLKSRLEIFGCRIFRKWLKPKVSCSSRQNREHAFFREMLQKIRQFPQFLFHGMDFWIVFSSEEWFGTKLRKFASRFVPGYCIPSDFSLPLNGSERNSGIFLFRGTAGTNHLFCLFRLPGSLTVVMVTAEPSKIMYTSAMFRKYLRLLYRILRDLDGGSEYIFRIYLNKVSLIIEEQHAILNTTNGKLAWASLYSCHIIP